MDFFIIFTINKTDKSSISFSNINIDDNSISDKVTIDNSDPISAEFNINLYKPGEYYQFTMDIVNNSKYDMKLFKITNEINKVKYETFNPKMVRLPAWILYQVYYLDNNKLVSKGDIIKSKETRKIKVIAKFKDNVPYNYLKTNLNIKFSLRFVSLNQDVNENIYYCDEIDTRITNNSKLEKDDCVRITNDYTSGVLEYPVFIRYKLDDKKVIIETSICFIKDNKINCIDESSKTNHYKGVKITHRNNKFQVILDNRSCYIESDGMSECCNTYEDGECIED